MKKFKSLASTHIRKIAILLVISTLSSAILCSCDDDKNSTQIETETEDETDVTTQENTEKPDEAKDEKTERQNQDADPTEATTQETNDAKPSTQHTSQSTNTEQDHVHNFKSETYYTTETQTVHHDAKTHTVHHDAVTHQETTYTTETREIGASGYLCDDGTFFEDEVAAAEHCSNHGGIGYCFWTKRETVTVQVPHTKTIVDQAAYDETVVDQEAYDEKVEVQVPHTRKVCSCGAVE